MKTLDVNRLLPRKLASSGALKANWVKHAFAFAFFGLVNAYSVSAEDAPMDLVDSILAENAPPLIANPIKLSGDFDILLNENGEKDSFLGKSEIWSDNWGVSAQLKQNEQSNVLGLPKDSSFFNLDVKRRFGTQDKSNIELGLGWQSLNIESQLDASGPKLSLSGTYNLLKDFQVYGATSYFPELEDTLKSDQSLSAYEFEAGLLYKPLPSVSLKAGYRVFNLDLEDPTLEELGSTSGFLLGTDLSW
ncbi:MAG: hypothetical protein MK188_07950 [Gammaproteobacteria bacterium]|nr:hypothetical protein [Gammaproteobacteria bacterium]